MRGQGFTIASHRGDPLASVEGWNFLGWKELSWSRTAEQNSPQPRNRLASLAPANGRTDYVLEETAAAMLLKAVLMLVASVFMPAVAAKAIRATTSAYSTRS